MRTSEGTAWNRAAAPLTDVLEAPALRRAEELAQPPALLALAVRRPRLLPAVRDGEVGGGVLAEARAAQVDRLRRKQAGHLQRVLEDGQRVDAARAQLRRRQEEEGALEL